MLHRRSEVKSCMGENESIEYLCIRIGDVNVGISSEQVKEVFEATSVTRLPCSPGFILGMVNVRGAVIPVLDLWEIADQSISIKKIVILNTQEGLVGILISELIDLIRFDTFKQSDGIKEKMGQLEKFFPTVGGKEDHYFIMQVNELISFTITQNIRQAGK